MKDLELEYEFSLLGSLHSLTYTESVACQIIYISFKGPRESRDERKKREGKNSIQVV